jgi:hypothetical protein
MAANLGDLGCYIGQDAVEKSRAKSSNGNDGRNSAAHHFAFYDRSPPNLGIPIAVTGHWQRRAWRVGRASSPANSEMTALAGIRTPRNFFVVGSSCALSSGDGRRVAQLVNPIANAGP